MSLKSLLSAGFLAIFGAVGTAHADARLQVIHNSSDPAAATVDVYLNGLRILDDFAFRAATPFINAPAGIPFNVGIAPGNSTSAADTLKNFVFTLADGETYVAIANGVLNPANFESNPDGRATGFGLFIKAGAREAGSGGNVEFFALHGATDAPTVDVVARGVATLVDNAAYGDITGYIAVPPASYTLDVKDSSGTVTVASYTADLSGLANGSAVVFASGFLSPANDQNGEAFGLYAALVDGSVIALPVKTPSARLQVIHNAADPAAASVDIYLDGGILLDNFAFRAATPFIDAPAGTPINIGVAGGNSTSAADTLKNFQLTLADGETYVAIANGVLNPANFESNPDGRATGFGLFIKAGAREAGSGGNVEFFALHGATDAPTVDVVARGVATLVDNAAYGDITGYIAVPPASYTLDVKDSSGTVTVASYTADLSGLANGSAVVFASGFLSPANDQNGEAFGLYAALADGSVITLPSEVTSVDLVGSTIPDKFELTQNYPNPFNPSTQISFSIAEAQFASLKVFNSIGQEVATLVNGEVKPGVYNVTFNAAGLPSGTYFYRLVTNSFVGTKKMMLVK